jgi:hypothetical protein
MIMELNRTDVSPISTRSVFKFIFSVGLIGISSVPNFRNTFTPIFRVDWNMSFDCITLPPVVRTTIATGGRPSENGSAIISAPSLGAKKELADNVATKVSQSSFNRYLRSSVFLLDCIMTSIPPNGSGIVVPVVRRGKIGLLMLTLGSDPDGTETRDNMKDLIAWIIKRNSADNELSSPTAQRVKYLVLLAVRDSLRLKAFKAFS